MSERRKEKASEAKCKGRKRDRVKNAIGQKLLDFDFKLCKGEDYQRLASSVGSSESPNGTDWLRPSVLISGRAPDYKRLVSPLVSDCKSLGNEVRRQQESRDQDIFNPPQPSDYEGIPSLPHTTFSPTSADPPNVQDPEAESSESDPGSIKVGP